MAARWLFIGDSITDAGRRRDVFGDLGDGYVASIAARADPTRVEVLNRGISGDRAADIERRWREDCLDLVPDLISLLVGVNDTWRRFTAAEVTSIPVFARSVERCLLAVSPVATQVVLIEPFILPVGAVTPEWAEEMTARQTAVALLAERYDAVLVPAQTVMSEAARTVPPLELLYDGVHPTPHGHRILADAWLAAVVQHLPSHQHPAPFENAS